MRHLTKVKLINWHFFTDETIVIDGSTLITGDNGSGKSTLVDAIQVAIVANLKKVRFNSSAMEDRTTRDLKSYLRGKTGTEGRTTFLRNDDFSSYIVLEITHTLSGKTYLIGVVFDYYHVTGEEEHIFFKIDEEPLHDDLFFYEPQKPRNRRQFFDFLKARGIKHRQYRNDINSYIYDLRQLFGAKESFFSLFTKGISFSPITDLRRFVYDYILEERDIDVENMREYFEKFRQVELMIGETRKEIAELEKIEAQYGEIENLRRNLDINDYMVARARWEAGLVKLNEGERSLQESRKNLKALEEQVQKTEDEKARLEEEIPRLEQAIRENEVAIKEEKLKQILEDLRKRQAELVQLEGNLLRQVKIEMSELQSLNKILRGVEAPLPLSQGLLQSEELWKQVLESRCSFFPDSPENRGEAAAGWKRAREWLTVQTHAWNREKEELQEEIAVLKRNISELERNQVLGSDSPAMKLKGVLEEHLLSPDGEKVPVHLFCEVIDIRDRRWQNAIEGYLHTQKFDLLVPPGYFQEALSLYERHKFTLGIERVGLVNTERLMAEVRPPMTNSLAEEIESKVSYASAYADWLMGNVIKCDSEQELSRHKRAITASCMLYQNHTARQIPRSRYELPYIGREAIRFQLARRKEELQEREKSLALCREKIELSAPAAIYAADKEDRYEGWSRIYKELQEKPAVEKELAARQQELLSLDFKELNRLKEQKTALEKEKKELENKLRGMEGKKGALQQEISFLTQQIAGLKEEISALEAAYQRFSSELEEGLLKQCEQKWEKESAKRSPATLLGNYSGSREGLNTRLGKQMQTLIRMRTDFVHLFDFPGDPEAPDNEAFRKRHRLLAESHLGDYEKQAKEAREQAEQSFQEHFIAKLGEYIKGAEEDIKELNRALKNMRFGSDSYHFSLTAKSDMRRYYEMIMDKGVYQGSIFREAFMEQHGEAIEELFAEITRRENEFQETMQTLTDYRSFLDFDIIITDSWGNKSHFSKVARDKSGGETQVPFYVAILASFYQAYQLYRKQDTLRLVVFDEAFNRMDADRIEEAITFMKNLGFQAIIVAPTGRIRLIIPHVNTNLIVMKDGFHSFIERVSRKDLLEIEKQSS
ncbi:MAG: ATP-binding protein [Dethiobacteria bacterium]|jgi:uncharacterized protein YPO0396